MFVALQGKIGTIDNFSYRGRRGCSFGSIIVVVGLFHFFPNTFF